MSEQANETAHCVKEISGVEDFMGASQFLGVVKFKTILPSKKRESLCSMKDKRCAQLATAVKPEMSSFKGL